MKITLIVLSLLTLAALACESNGTGDADEAEERRKGFHCLTEWDGNHDGLEVLVKDQLNDPGSMETHSTRITPVNADGKHIIFMEFSAKNAFGGRVRNTAGGLVDPETCEATLVGIE